MKIRWNLLFVLLVCMVSAILLSDVIADYNSSIKLMEKGIYLEDISIVSEALKRLNRLTAVVENPEMLREIYIAMGDGFYFLQLYDKALRNYEKAIEVFKKEDERYMYALYSLFYCAYNLGDEEKISEYFRFLENTRYEDECRFTWGNMLYENGEYSKAADILKEIDPSFDYFDEAKLIEGVSLYKIGDYAKAKKVLIESVNNAKDVTTLHSALYYAALSASKLGQHDWAIEKLEQLHARDVGEMKYGVLLALGGEYMALSKYEKAVSVFKEALEIAPNTTEEIILEDNIAWCLYNLGDYRGAARLWEESAERSKNRENKERMYSNAVSSYQKVGDQESAIRVCEKAAKELPQRMEKFLIRKATILLDLGRFAESADVLRTLKSGEASYWLAVSLMRMGRFDEALKAIEEAENQGYDRVRIARAKANIFLNTGKFDEALSILQETLKVAGDEKPYVLLDMGLLYLSRKNLLKAVENLSKAFYEGDGDVKLEAALNLGRTYERMEEWERAAEWYRKASEHDKGKYGDELTYKYYFCLLKLEDYDTIITELSSRDLSDKLRYVLGEACLKKGDVTGAWKAVNVMLNRADKLGELIGSSVFYIAGKYYEQRGMLENAEHYYKKTVEEYPESAKAPWALLDAGLMLYKAGKYERAKITLALLVASYEDFVKNDVALYYLALIYEKTGEIDKAVKVYETILKDYPNTARKAEIEERLKKLSH